LLEKAKIPIDEVISVYEPLVASFLVVLYEFMNMRSELLEVCILTGGHRIVFYSEFQVLQLCSKLAIHSIIQHIHFFVDNVRFSAHSALKESKRLKNWRPDFAEA